MAGIMFIMQGAQGSGKTSTAQRIAAPRFSTDDYFSQTEEGYVFKQDELPKAHKWNQDRVRVYLSGIKEPPPNPVYVPNPPVDKHAVIDNCNTRCWEARPYVEMAKEFGMEVVFVRCEGKFQNIHGVPEAVVNATRDRLEALSVKACLEAKYPWE